MAPVDAETAAAALSLASPLKKLAIIVFAAHRLLSAGKSMVTAVSSDPDAGVTVGTLSSIEEPNANVDASHSRSEGGFSFPSERYSRMNISYALKPTTRPSLYICLGIHSTS